MVTCCFVSGPSVLCFFSANYWWFLSRDVMWSGWEWGVGGGVDASVNISLAVFLFSLMHGDINNINTNFLKMSNYQNFTATSPQNSPLYWHRLFIPLLLPSVSLSLQLPSLHSVLVSTHHCFHHSNPPHTRSCNGITICGHSADQWPTCCQGDSVNCSGRR